jgi:hypothetical protein
MIQREVHGNKEKGCDAIVVGKQKHDFDSVKQDDFSSFTYVAEGHSGALSVISRWGLAVRVFCSTAIHGPFRVTRSMT